MPTKSNDWYDKVASTLVKHMKPLGWPKFDSTSIFVRRAKPSLRNDRKDKAWPRYDDL